MKNLPTLEEYLNESKLHEMALGDINVEKILKEFDNGDKKRKEEIAERICGKPSANRNVIIKELQEASYEDIQELLKDLNIKVK